MTSKAPPLYIMLLLVCIGSFGAVLYTPALPAIGEYFKIGARLTEMSMTVYLLGYALGQLFWGPSSNRIGRKNTLFIGLSVAIIGALFSILSSITHLYSLFIVGRVLFSLGATAGLQVIYTMIGDLYVPPKSIKIASYMTLTFAISPSISTTIGGFLTQYIGWESCFYFLLLYSAVLLYLCKSLPETLETRDVNALKIKNLAKAYLNQLQDKKVMTASIIIGLAISFNYTFATLAPALAITGLKVTPSQYGLYNIIPSIAVVAGSLLAAFLASRHNRPLLQVFYAIALTFVGVGIMLGCFSFGLVSTYTLFIPYAIAMLGQPIIETNVLCLALHHHKDKAITSSTINCITILLAMISSFLASLLGSDSPSFIPILFLILTVGIFCFYKSLKKEPQN